MSKYSNIQFPGIPLLLIALILPHSTDAASIFDEGQWLLGAISTPELSIYAGVEEEIQLIPYIAWEKANWYLGIDRFSYTWQEAKDLELDLLAKPRFGSSASSDPERYGNIERDFTLEAGMSVSYGFFPVSLEGEFLADVSNTHNGYSAEFAISMEIPYDQVELEASAGVVFKNQRLTQFLYGVTPAQATTQIETYSPQADLSYEASVEVTRMLSPRCALVAEVTAEFASSAARLSPLTDRDIGLNGVIGVIYVF